MSALQTYSSEQISAALPLLTDSEKLELANALDDKNHNEIWDLCGEKKASLDAGPLLWLTQYTKTEDTHWVSKGTQPIAPFPRKEYFAVVMKYLIERPKVFIPKTREMMTSWLACGYIAAQCQWLPGLTWVMQSQKETKANELVNYCRQLYRLQDPWMKKRVSVIADNVSELKLSNGSKIIGIPQGADQWRSHHPHGALFDEMAHLVGAEECFNIAAPVARQIIGVSSVQPSWYANECGL